MSNGQNVKKEKLNNKINNINCARKCKKENIVLVNQHLKMIEIAIFEILNIIN